MNNSSPLIPQGSFLEQKTKGRARVKIAVFVVLAIHGIGLLALLMQGCKKEPEPTNDASTNATQAFAEPSNAPPSTVAQPTPPPQTNLPAATDQAMAAPPSLQGANPTEYKVARGDNYTTIAKKFHTTTKAIMDANPGVDPTKLQIGQTLHLPAASAISPPGTIAGATSSTPDVAAGEQVYSVKSGDTLIGIANQFKISVKALRSANNLTTDKITVGQKLKIPVKVPTGTNPPTTSAPGTGTSAQ